MGKDGSEKDADRRMSRIAKLRVFESEPGRMDVSIFDVGGGVLVISRFTLFGSLKKGNGLCSIDRPLPAQAVPLYEYFVGQLSDVLGREVLTGVFGNRRVIDACNDGPVSLMVDSKNREF